MDKLTFKQKIIAAAVGISLLIVSYLLLQYKMKSDIIITENVSTETKEEVNNEKDEPKEEIQLPKEIVVHVSGSVRNSGIVKLSEGARVNDAVERAGGVLREADINKVNLAAILNDGDKVYIPKVGEKYEEVTFTQAVSNQGIININTASLNELDDIPGVGPSTAEKIIEYRKSNGFFKKVEDIKNVSGIGEKKFEKIKKYITI